MVNTVLGEITAEKLNITLMHEHLLCSDWVKRMCWPGYFQQNEAIQKIVSVVERAKRFGVNSIVDATPPNLGRDIKVLRAVSEKTGVNIIASTGSYATEDKWLERITEDGLLDLYLRDIFDGMQGFKCKAGVIKYATDEPGFTELNLKMLRCAARAQKRSGLPIITHCRPPGRQYGICQQELFKKEEADLEKIVIGHFRKGDSLEYAEEVLRKGSFLAIDQMNWQERNLSHNIDMIKKLIDLGWNKQLILSQDAVICYNFEHWQFTGKKPYIDDSPIALSYLREIAWKKLLERGIKEKALETIFINNPRSLFSS